MWWCSYYSYSIYGNYAATRLSIPDGSVFACMVFKNATQVTAGAGGETRTFS
jgi:hypothetical protein